MTTTGDRIRDLRQAKGWTQQELADRLHISRPAVNKWEHGGSEPSHDTLRELADMFGVSTDYLLGRTDIVTDIIQYRDNGDGTFDEVMLFIPPDIELQARRDAEKAGKSFSEYVVDLLRDQLTRK